MGITCTLFQLCLIILFYFNSLALLFNFGFLFLFLFVFDIFSEGIIVQRKYCLIGCNKSQFYSLPYGQAVGGMYKPKIHFN